jgi:hypothetical protein
MFELVLNRIGWHDFVNVIKHFSVSKSAENPLATGKNCSLSKKSNALQKKFNVNGFTGHFSTDDYIKVLSVTVSAELDNSWKQ